MRSEGARVVRIARERSVAREEISGERSTLAKPPEPSRVAVPRSARPPTATGKIYSNLGAVGRSLRLYLLGFVAAPVAIWAAVMALVLTSPYLGVRTDLAPIVIITAVLGVSLVGGYVATLGRTPRYFRYNSKTRRLTVHHLQGGSDKVPLSPEAFQMTLEVHLADPISRAETELIEVRNPPFDPVRWVVERQLLDPILPRHPGKPGTQRHGPSVPVPVGVMLAPSAEGSTEVTHDPVKGAREA
ncbi:MAG: hypothetical protein KGJ23_02265 [Euryarchaeota archaeon]|nr:hypothetical protein [Euryarchaeota archaeon]MDE1879556.1 hypothetical protein [Euryarchaeota archaeon]MDE2046071.1 hypothetical protein [Thermoplasmata archaeon]